MADILEALVESGTDGLLGDGGEHFVFERLILGTDGAEDHLGSVGQTPGRHVPRR